MARVRLWVDTDVGDDPDDVVALLCAAAHPSVELVGVSTVAGLAAVRPELAAEVVDVAVHDGSAPTELVEAFRAAAPDALLAIGPLANVAMLVDAGVVLGDVTVMGGALAPVRHRGRTFTAEHNFASQPAAAARVVAETGAVLVPLDTTVHARVGAADLARLVASHPVLEREVGRWLANQRAAAVPPDQRALVLHDPLALLVCIADAEVDARRDVRSLVVDGASGVVRADPLGRDHAVVTDVDAPRVVARVLAVLAA